MLQKWVLVHSVIYYDYDTSVVSDHTYDMNLVQLANLMKEHPKEARKSKYASCFRGFDGSTGYDLISRLPEGERLRIKGQASFVVSLCERNKKDRG